MDTDLVFYSHTGKPLQKHLQGVMAKVKYRTENLPTTLNLKLAKIAALFHDLGKINPNFQTKLKGEKADGYSSHAYLSAYAWFRFCLTNQNQVIEWLGEKEKIKQRHKSLGMMVSKHHGNLADFAPNAENHFSGGIFNKGKTRAKSPSDEFADFIKENPNLRISDFLQLLLPHKQFVLDCSEKELEGILNFKIDISVRGEEIIKPLEFFLETQFCFACLLEADKRDAGDNETYNRQNLRQRYFEENFGKKIDERLNSFNRISDLNNLRTAMRLESVENLRLKLAENKRVFTLSAPTGAGKTMMLLALAKEILAKDKSLSVIYALPFLSITEQVEGICRNIFYDEKDAVLRIDSRAENQTIQDLQKKLDDEQTDENVKRLLQEAFTETTFDHPFIITTFVQVFEALLSNRNATVLRLPNFSKTVFLIDEIQALPYRLYSFFTALLDEFCRQFDSYAIISTATMPHLDISEQQTATHEAGRKLFANYQKPDELLDAEKYFSENAFNRYRITQIKQENFSIQDLANHIENRNESCLVILNTIDDTKDLYKELSARYRNEECILLNTHFTLKSRRTKIWLAKRRLKYKKIILISTQLIEAGVDIDFPTVYRDFCPLPSLIQSAGRCNRNGKLDFGEVFFFALQKDNGKLSSDLIYRDEAKGFLNYCRKKLPEIITEPELFEIQKDFFKTEIGEYLKFGTHKQYGEELDFVTLINKAAFETLGKFCLIDERQFGFEFRYYIPKNEQDKTFEELQNLTQITDTRNYQEAMQKRIVIETKLKEMSARIVTFRVRDEKFAPAQDSEECCKIRKLGDLSKYGFEKGIEISANAGCII